MFCDVELPAMMDFDHFFLRSNKWRLTMCIHKSTRQEFATQHVWPHVAITMVLTMSNAGCMWHRELSNLLSRDLTTEWEKLTSIPYTCAPNVYQMQTEFRCQFYAKILVCSKIQHEFYLHLFTLICLSFAMPWFNDCEYGIDHSLSQVSSNDAHVRDQEIEWLRLQISDDTSWITMLLNCNYRCFN